MKRGPGSFIKNKAGKLEENLKDPVMKKRKEIREKKAREKKGGQPEGKKPETEATKGGGPKKRPIDAHEAKAEIIDAMKQVIDIGENLISGGRPAVKSVEEILGYQISEEERNDLMEVFTDVS